MSRKLVFLVVIGLAAGFVQTSLANVLDPSLIAWWKFDEGVGTLAADSGDNGIDGTLVSDPVWRQDGVHKGCLFFDGAQAHVQVPNQDLLNPGDGSFTVVFWASIETTPGTSGDTTWDLPVAKRDAGSNGYYVGASRGQGGATETGYRFMLGDTSSSRTDTPYLTVPLAEWVFVAAVLDRDQDIQKISVDGGQTWASTTPPTGPIAPGQDLGLGWDIGQNNYWHHGTIDDVALFSRALSDAQIGLIMEEGMTPALAKDSQPRDAATDVPADVTLSWAPGLYAVSHDVYFGTVFEEVSTASRADPMGVLVSQGQAGTTYDPDGVLDFEQTYYWRVDEVNAAPDSTIFTGEVWSFTVEPYAYAVADIIVTTSGASVDGKGPENTINGSGLNADDQHSTDTDDMWEAAPVEGEPLYIQFEFDRAYKLYEMFVWNYNAEFEPMLGFGLKDVTVQISEDGVDWTDLKDVQFAQAPGDAGYVANTIVDLEGVPARYVRLMINSAYGDMSQRVGLSEIRFLYVPIEAREPDPTDEATDVSVDTMLDWRAGRGATSHEIYLGIDLEALTLVDTTADSQYNPGGLDLGMTYYWRIDEVNEVTGTWEGQTWSFATQEFIVIDDFESYTDFEGSLIYESWIDGWENETGAQVGYMDPPFAEGAIVNSGSQSMPLIYDNSVDLGYSEAEHFFDVPQDWTVYGTQILTVHFRGSLDNTGQLYVKINNTKVSYDGDPGDIAGLVWKPWNIDLSTVGGNLTRVDTLKIGIDGANASGTLYIDDIRLYRRSPDAVKPVEPDSARLVAYYAFDNDVTDGSGNGHDGVIDGDPVYVAGVRNQAIEFDGFDDYVRVAHHDSLNPGTGSFSFSFWMNLDPSAGSAGTASWDLVLAKRDAGGNGYYVGSNRSAADAGQAGCKFMLGNLSANRVDTPYLPVLLGEWVSVAAVLDRDQDIHKISVDGGQTWATATPPTGTVAPVQDLGIGWDIGQNNYWTHGAVDEVRLYDYALSDAEAAWLAGSR